MPLQKENINLNFGQGLDTKTDPFQVVAGKMLQLENSVFTKGGQLTKRYGFEKLTSLPDVTSKTATTFEGNLVAIGNNINILSESTNTWVTKQNIQPTTLSVIETVRTATNILNSDTAIASNGLACVVYYDSTSNSYYSIVDSQTGEIIVPSTTITGTTLQPRVFFLGNYFIVTFVRIISATYHLQYIAIPIVNPSSPSAETDFVSIVNTSNPAYDGVVYNNSLYIAFNASDGGGAIRVFSLNSGLQQSSQTIVTGHSATALSVTYNQGTGVTNIYITAYNSGTMTCIIFSITPGGTEVLTPTTVFTGVSSNAVTSTVVNNVAYIIYETINTYTYDSSVRTDYSSYITVTMNTGGTSGTVGSPVVILRSVGLASKSFYLNSIGKIYALFAYGGLYQPSYFLSDISGNIIGKLAYSNGSGYTFNEVLPSANVNGSQVQISYLFADQVVAVNKTQGVANNAGIYAQKGVNLATFTIQDQPVITSEIGSNLHISGALLDAYDGAKATEQNFNVWPENVEGTYSLTGGGMAPEQYFYQVTYEWTDAKGNIHRSAPSVPVEVDASAASPTPITFTATFSSGSTTMTVSSSIGLFVGQIITDNTTPSNIQANTHITSINGTTITIDLPTMGAATSDTLQTIDTLSVTLNIPTLRLTYKTLNNNPVRIVVYRWSTNQQIYYMTSSILNPILNNTTIDSVTFTDTNSDFAILGNVIIYTTGGVLEDIGPPGAATMALFKSRLFIVDTEDRNLLWYSKQIIENTPVEFSDALTYFVAPTTGAEGSTGAVTALAPMDDKLIAFKDNSIYYIPGEGPDNTGANNDFPADPIFITSVVGCSNQSSIVFTPNGLMFQSNKGIWLLGRDLSTQYIGAPVEAYNNNKVESAINIPGTNQVRFTLDNGITLMYDYYFQQWGTFVGVPAISSTIYLNLHTYINSFGQVFQENPGSYVDGSSPVLMSFTTAWFNLTGLQGYERAYYFFLLGTFITPHTLSIGVAYDYNPSIAQSSIITPNNYSNPYGVDTLYGSGNPYGGPSNVEQWRVFLAQQKCQAFQLTISENFNSAYGSMPGEGLTLSGIDLVFGAKKGGYPRLNPSNSVG